MVVAYKIYQSGDPRNENVIVKDTIMVADTIQVDGVDSVVWKVGDIIERTVEKEVYSFDPDYVKRYTEIVNPVLEKAEAAGYKVFAVTAPNPPALIDDFRHETQSAYPFYVADDLLLKTIQRSNPGLVLWHDGKIVAKWHFKKLPTFEEIQSQYLK